MARAKALRTPARSAKLGRNDIAVDAAEDLAAFVDLRDVRYWIKSR
jgi:hypothetical protein